MLTAIDLFSGAGGFSLGALESGFDVLFGVENNPHAANTYRSGFIAGYSPSTFLAENDISELLEVGFFDPYQGEIDLLLGGPPCQPFSTRRNKALPPSPKASLLSKYVEILAFLEPRAFMMENVRGLLSADNGSHWRAYLEMLESTGYKIQWKLVDFSRLGVPQRRVRLITVGLHPEVEGDYLFPEENHTPLTVGEILAAHSDALPPLRAGEFSESDPNHRARRHTQTIISMMEMIKPGESIKDCAARGGRSLPCHRGREGQFSDTYGRLHPDSVAPTMTGGCTVPSKGRYTHPEQNRGLSTREAALFQGFPLDYVFKGGLDSQALQVGNAVPPPGATKLLLPLHKVLQANPKTGSCKPNHCDS